VEEELLVDSGAIYVVLPTPTLRCLGIRPHGKERFALAERHASDAGDGDGVLRNRRA